MSGEISLGKPEELFDSSKPRFHQIERLLHVIERVGQALECVAGSVQPSVVAVGGAAVGGVSDGGGDVDAILAVLRQKAVDVLRGGTPFAHFLVEFVAVAVEFAQGPQTGGLHGGALDEAFTTHFDGSAGDQIQAGLAGFSDEACAPSVGVDGEARQLVLQGLGLLVDGGLVGFGGGHGSALVGELGKSDHSVCRVSQATEKSFHTIQQMKASTASGIAKRRMAMLARMAITMMGRANTNTMK